MKSVLSATEGNRRAISAQKLRNHEVEFRHEMTKLGSFVRSDVSNLNNV
jgi:hypothetical protein